MPIRKDPIDVNSFTHVLNKGPRGADIVFDEVEKWRFIRLLYYLNDGYQNNQWERDVYAMNGGFLARPPHWPAREPLVSILCFCLQDNHYHLLLKEIKEGGVSEFMQRLSNSMTEYFHKKWSENGPLFQSTYKRIHVDTDQYLVYLAVYIMVKNVFEQFPGGLRAAIDNFDEAWEWALSMPFSSLPDYASHRQWPIIEKDILGEQLKSPEQFKEFARSMMEWKGEQLRVEQDIGDQPLE